jgi:DNA-binding LacI/PurR family transcriptional regulator
MNIYDLAREAGVSIATASKALNGRRDVNEQTRQRVLEVAKKLNYHPSHMARGLARRRTENIGVVALRRFKVPFFTNPFYSRVLEGMETEVTARNYNMLLSVLPADEAGTPLQLPKLVREKNADGLVLLGEMPGDLLKEVFERRIPSVIVDFYTPKLEAHYILSDNRGGLRQLVKHLAELKHRKVAFVLPSSLRDYSFSERQKGFEQACQDLKIDGRVWSVPETWPQVEAELRKQLLQADRPTALLACNDEHALAAIRVAKEIGLRVPQDISITGFDDIDEAQYGNPMLTTVRVDKQGMGEKAIQTVFRLLEPPLEPASRLDLPVELIARQSTGPAPA